MSTNGNNQLTFQFFNFSLHSLLIDTMSAPPAKDADLVPAADGDEKKSGGDAEKPVERVLTVEDGESPASIASPTDLSVYF